jgi:hypothetical protein
MQDRGGCRSPAVNSTAPDPCTVILSFVPQHVAATLHGGGVVTTLEWAKLRIGSEFERS